jgi:predicted transcriptional regulator
VVVYASSPVQRVVGYFEVDGVSESDPSALWAEHSDVGEIGAEEFREYYDGAERGVAIHVGRVHHLLLPLPLDEVVPSAVPPQSFAYARPEVIGELAVRAAM